MSRRGTKTTRRPAIHRKPWGDRAWPTSSTPPASNAWAETEAWLARAVDLGAFARVVGGGGKWDATRPDGCSVTILADTDRANRAEAAILR